MNIGCLFFVNMTFNPAEANEPNGLFREHLMADFGDKIYPIVMINIDVILLHPHTVNINNGQI